MQFNLYKLMKPIMEAVGQKPFNIVTPMRRYASSTCFENGSHITNFGLDDYDENMKRDLRRSART